MADSTTATISKIASQLVVPTKKSMLGMMISPQLRMRMKR
jgi:hypothetical protein